MGAGVENSSLSLLDLLFGRLKGKKSVYSFQKSPGLASNLFCEFLPLSLFAFFFIAGKLWQLFDRAWCWNPKPPFSYDMRHKFISALGGRGLVDTSKV